MTTFDQLCDDARVIPEEREALVHRLASMRYRDTLKLIDGPLLRAVKAAKPTPHCEHGIPTGYLCRKCTP